MEKYYIDALLYTDSCKEYLQPENPDSSNEADIEPKSTKECAWEVNMSKLEELDQDNYTEHDPRTECIWELGLVALEGLEHNNVINVTNNEGD